MVENVTRNMSAKAVRMSRVTFAAAVMGLIWLSLDEFTNVFFSAAWVSAVTSVVMLFAQFSDFKFKSSGGTTFGGDADGSDA